MKDAITDLQKVIEKSCHLSFYVLTNFVISKKKIEDSKYEYCINVLNVFIKHQVGQKLGKFDVEKRRAIELEDFDTAKKKKVRFFVFLFYTYFDRFKFMK